MFDNKVGIAECFTCTSPGRLIALGLGSCVGVTMLDVVNGIGGMAHIMLPESNSFKEDNHLSKYVDTAIPLLLQKVLKRGARRSYIQVKIAGGAQMFKSMSDCSLLNIGDRNVKKCHQVLNELNIKITGTDTGGDFGRTMILDCSLRKVFVSTAGNNPREI